MLILTGKLNMWTTRQVKYVQGLWILVHPFKVTLISINSLESSKVFHSALSVNGKYLQGCKDISSNPHYHLYIK